MGLGSQEDTIDWEDPLMLEWYKQKVYHFFGAQIEGGGIQGESFLFYKARDSDYAGGNFRRAAAAVKEKKDHRSGRAR